MSEKFIAVRRYPHQETAALHTESVAETRAALVEAAQDHNGVGPGGALIRVHGAAREHVPQLVAALAAAEVPMFRVEPDEPSLEDVYFALEHE